MRFAVRRFTFGCALAIVTCAPAAAQTPPSQPVASASAGPAAPSPAAPAPDPPVPGPSSAPAPPSPGVSAFPQTNATTAPPQTSEPSAAPSTNPSPNPSPTPAALSLAKTRLQLNLATTSETQITGGVAPYAAVLSAPIADIAIDPVTAILSLKAIANGSATLTVTDAAGSSVTASLLVAPNAGFVPANVQLALTGNPSPDELAAQIRAALVRASRPLGGVRLSAQDDVSASLHPGERLDAPVRVHLDGVGRYVDVDGIAEVHVVVDSAAPIVPSTLFYSDDPEKIAADGVLFAGTMSSAQPVRLYYYHQAATPGHEIAILLDAPDGSATVQILGQGAGPNPAVMFVGQSATFRYLDAHVRGSGVTLDVPVGAPVEVFAGDRPMAAGDLVAGVLDLSVVAGDPVRVTVVSLSEGADLRAFLGSAELPGDGKNRRGEYDLSPASPLSLAYRAGDPEPAPVAVGGLGSALQNRRPGGHVLAGDYGLLRPLDLQLSNPLAVPTTVYLYEQPIGYPVTTTIAFDGDPAPQRLQCVKTAANRYLVRAFVLAPGGSERITGSYMTDGGSTYPLTFGLTVNEPLGLPATMTVPDGCFPKPAGNASPAPGSSPAPSSSPAASPSPVSSASPQL